VPYLHHAAPVQLCKLTRCEGFPIAVPDLPAPRCSNLKVNPFDKTSAHSTKVYGALTGLHSHNLPLTGLTLPVQAGGGEGCAAAIGGAYGPEVQVCIPNPKLQPQALNSEPKL